MMDVIFGEIGSFSPNQKSGICIIERWLQIGRKPFKGISVALHHHFWRQKGERRPTTMFIISGNLENTTSQPSIPTISQPVQHTTYRISRKTRLIFQLFLISKNSCFLQWFQLKTNGGSTKTIFHIFVGI